MGPGGIVVGPLGFEPRIACAPGMYPILEGTILAWDTCQARLFVQTRRRPHGVLPMDQELLNIANPADTIINSLIKMKASGLTDVTIGNTSYRLRRLKKLADLNKPEEVKMAIATMDSIDNQTRNMYAKSYNYYAQCNNILWTKPHYRWERRIPLIPTSQAIDKIISASTKKFATIFTILKETGLEAHELSSVARKEIDIENGIHARGCKGHNSRQCKLKQPTAELLHGYLALYTDDKPFPRAKIMGEQWRSFRNKVAENLNQPQLKNIPMRNLRHYCATSLYDKTKDILLVMQKLGHKKIETTMFYTQLISFSEEEEYTCKAAANAKEAMNLIETDSNTSQQSKEHNSSKNASNPFLYSHKSKLKNKNIKC